MRETGRGRVSRKSWPMICNHSPPARSDGECTGSEVIGEKAMRFLNQSTVVSGLGTAHMSESCVEGHRAHFLCVVIHVIHTVIHTCACTHQHVCAHASVNTHTHARARKTFFAWVKSWFFSVKLAGS